MNILTFLKSIFFSGPLQPTPDATLNDVDAIYHALEATSADGTFVAFIPCVARDGESDVLNIQFSREKGNLGLDWVLISPVNILEKDRFVQVCQSYKAEVKEREENGCQYLRVEGDDILSLCKNVISAFYPAQQDLPLNLVIEGFHWAKAE